MDEDWQAAGTNPDLLAAIAGGDEGYVRFRPPTIQAIQFFFICTHQLSAPLAASQVTIAKTAAPKSAY
jgi:hypothetical protein